MGRNNGVAPRVVVCVLLALLMAVPAASAQTQPAPGVHVGTTPTELQIIRFYRAVLDRDPDAAGMAYWHSHLTTGVELTTIADSFAKSDEFALRFGVDPGPNGDVQFLQQVYRNVLDRVPDAAGQRYWAQLLRTGIPRAQIVLWFSESQEFINRTGLAPPKLPPFEGQITSVTAADLGVSWREGCPVPPRDLRMLVMTFVDFTGGVQTGELVVHADSAEDILVVFQRLYENHYPVQSMRTIDEFGGSDDASMDANNTSAFNCRNAVFSTSWSRHAYGQAIDINPLVNPYVSRRGVVLPPSGAPYADRSVHNPSLIREGDIVVQSFDAIGWHWGGRWNSVKDYQHFSIDNR